MPSVCVFCNYTFHFSTAACRYFCLSHRVERLGIWPPSLVLDFAFQRWKCSKGSIWMKIAKKNTSLIFIVENGCIKFSPDNGGCIPQIVKAQIVPGGWERGRGSGASRQLFLPSTVAPLLHIPLHKMDLLFSPEGGCYCYRVLFKTTLRNVF